MKKLIIVLAMAFAVMCVSSNASAKQFELRGPITALTYVRYHDLGSLAAGVAVGSLDVCMDVTVGITRIPVTLDSSGLAATGAAITDATSIGYLLSAFDAGIAGLDVNLNISFGGGGTGNVTPNFDGLVQGDDGLCETWGW